MNKTILEISVTFLGAFLLLSSNPAYAYLDPGTGSVLLQGFIGAIAGAFVIIRVYWHKILRFLGLRKDLDKKQDDEDKA